MSIVQPNKTIVPFGKDGLRDSIPQSSDIYNGRAGYDKGWPPICKTPKEAGGIPPAMEDFNGILFDLSSAIQYFQAGGSFPYDATWAASVGGYPLGALVSRSDMAGLWRNTVANNLTDPESGGAGWEPESAGLTAITMSSSNVTLTPLQASNSIIVISGTLTSNLQLIFPAYKKQWTIKNNTSGKFSITCKTASGTGAQIQTNSSSVIYCDGVDINTYFPSLLEEAGYQKTPSGLIEQWVQGASDSNGVLQLTLPISFPNKIIGGIACELNSAGWPLDDATIWGYDRTWSTLSMAVARVRRFKSGGPIVGQNGIIRVWGI